MMVKEETTWSTKLFLVQLSKWGRSQYPKAWRRSDECTEMATALLRLLWLPYCHLPEGASPPKDAVGYV